MTRRMFVGAQWSCGRRAGSDPVGGKAPAYAQSRSLHYLQSTSFIAAADDEISRQAEEFTRATGIDMTIE